MNSFENIPISKLIPQKPPFVMIDRMLKCDDESTMTELEVRPDNIFVMDGNLVAPGLAENIAQTCAACIGYDNMNRGEAIKVGVIGAISNFDVARLPRIGEKITTTIRIVEEVFQMTLVEASVQIGAETIATANMKTSLTDADAKN